MKKKKKYCIFLYENDYYVFLSATMYTPTHELFNEIKDSRNYFVICINETLCSFITNAKFPPASL